MSRRRFCLAAVVVVIAPATLLACLWDYDTLKQERARFPSTLELITGKFLRHSKEFYEWRIEDRLKKLKDDPNNAAFYDDLAVAYEKTGQHTKAIETILEKEKIKPGLYETYSNLGTFHILAGDFEKGLPFIDKALAINPNAHFGRERYQKLLVEYALTRKKDGKITFPLRRGGDVNPDYKLPRDFRDAVRRNVGKETLSQDETQLALKAILGMMRFANHDNPLLLEALGDLLYNFGEESSDGKLLSARAYLKASYAVKDEGVRKEYRELAYWARQFQTPDGRTEKSIELEDLESQFAAELKDAENWYAELRQKEIDWIKAGKDVDAEFDKLYTSEPQVIEIASASPPSSFWDAPGGWGAVVLVTAVIGLALIVGVMIMFPKRRRVRSKNA